MANWRFSTGASGYDAKDRLTVWNRTDANRDQSWTLTYEGAWQQFTDVAVTATRTHGPAHELTAIDSTSPTYDSKGKLTQNVTGDSYTWDFDNRVRTATVSGAVSTYAYDALGRRASKAVDAAKTVFVPAVYPIEYSPQAGQVLAEFPSGAAPSSPTEKYIYASCIDEPIIKVGSSGTVYYHAHNLYSVAALTDTDGSPIERYAYTAYGVLTILAADGSTVRSSSSYGNAYTFTGRRWDPELSQYYYRARYYDPVLGRFIVRDPLRRADVMSNRLDNETRIYDYRDRLHATQLRRFLTREPVSNASSERSLFEYVSGDPISTLLDPSGNGWVKLLDDMWTLISGGYACSTCAKWLNVYNEFSAACEEEKDDNFGQYFQKYHGRGRRYCGCMGILCPSSYLYQREYADMCCVLIQVRKSEIRQGYPNSEEFNEGLKKCIRGWLSTRL